MNEQPYGVDAMARVWARVVASEQLYREALSLIRTSRATVRAARRWSPRAAPVTTVRPDPRARPDGAEGSTRASAP
jgi:hypothetical protein